MDALIAKMPAAWAPAMRPFLQRAEEFQQKDPVVSYFLRTHAVHIGVKKRSKEDKEGTKFLNALLEELSHEKVALGARLNSVDGRTTLTKTALALFQRADEEEQAGQCHLSLVRLFFTAAVLFEATGQFTKDGTMDPIAAERCRYAKYTASRMKKFIDSGEMYTRTDHGSSATYGSSSNMNSAPNSSSHTPQNCSPVPHSQERQRRGDVVGTKAAVTIQDTPQESPHGAVAPEAGNGLVSMDDVFAAQKHAKQAVSALQFLDHRQAVIELRMALSLLEKS